MVCTRLPFSHLRMPIELFKRSFPPSPQRPRTRLRRHEDGLSNVVKHLQQELRIGTRLCGRLNLARVELARLPVCGLNDAVDGGKDGRGEELGAHGPHVEVHERGGQGAAAKEDRSLYFTLDLQSDQGR
jgi:hypothetical protein